jgi:hypothetical protein
MAISFHPLLDQSIQVIPIFVIKENVPARHFRVASHDKARQGREVLVFWPWQGIMGWDHH